MRTSRLIAYVAMPIFFVTVFISSCKKEIKQEESTPVLSNTFAKEAKQYVASQLANDKIDALASGSVSKKGSNQLKSNNRLSVISKKINWQAATTITQNEIEFLVVPFTESITPFKNKQYEFLRTLIFSKQSDKIEMNILEILGDKGATLGSQHANLIASSIKKLFFNQVGLIEGIDASVMLFDNRYTQTKSFHLNDGVWEVKRIQFRSDLDITK